MKDLKFLLAKRVFDLILGVPLAIIATPIIILAAVMIRLETPGNPFFLQRRIGYNGQLFTIIKLRGMYIDARQRFPELYDYSRYDDLDFKFHYETDPRVTKVGSFIRKTSIDELPNFYNVVLGTMSLVGPRPEVPDVFSLYGQYKEDYVSVKPGITCSSKISGRDNLSKKETIELDIDYIKNQSFVSDLQILLKTFMNVMFKKDVY